MKITVIAVGKVKEKFYRDALAEYEKRLLRYCKLEILELADEKTPEYASKREEEQILEKEAQRIIKCIRPGMQVFSLSIEGETFSSPQFAEFIDREGLQGHSWLCFIIGGSLGLHPTVGKYCQKAISFSALTFPHQLMRVILLEQIYRSYRIIHQEPYHK